jgi:type IV fimbrial biogenesis protein FimT
MTTDIQQGFTLIELLVVITIGAILVAIAAPSFVDMNKNSRINGAVREFQSIVQLARTEAITRNAIVNIYNAKAAGDWSGDIYLCQAATATTICTLNDANFIKRFAIGDLSADGVDNGDITINSSTEGNSFISFNSNGRLNGSTPIAVGFCDNRPEGANRNFQLLSIAVTGRPTTTDIEVAACDP